MVRPAEQVCEAAERVTGVAVAEGDLAVGVSLCAGMALDDQHITDSAVVLSIPAVVHAMAERRVHVLAPTHELAARRATWLRPVAALLDLRVGLLGPGDGQATRAACYEADILCAQVDDVVYDVLRDSLAWDPEDEVGAGRDVAVIDQIDTVLLDQGVMLPMITAPDPARHDWLRRAEALAAELQHDRDFVHAGGRAGLTPAGVEQVLRSIGLATVLNEHIPVFDMVQAALTARTCYSRGRDYDIADGEVVAGAPLGRDVQAAIAVHEGLAPSTAGGTTLAVTTVRNHIMGYELVTGIGVVTETAADQIRELYGLRIKARRAGEPISDDVICDDGQSRMGAVLDAIRDARADGRSALLAAASADLVPAARAVGLSLVDGVTVLGPDDPVPDGRHGMVVGLGRHRTRRRDIRLARTAEHARFYLTTSELVSMAGDRAERKISAVRAHATQPVSSAEVTELVEELQEGAELVDFYRHETEFSRATADVREAQHAQFASLCAPLLDDQDVVAVFRGLLWDHLDVLVREYRKGRLPYPDLLGMLGELYPCELPPRPPPKLTAEIRTDAERALTLRIDEVDGTAGDGAFEKLLGKIVLSTRDKLWRGHIVDLDTLAVVSRTVHPQRRIREFQPDADERFTSLWTEFVETTIGYTFHLSITDRLSG